MKATLLGPFRRAIAAAATLTGKRFGLLVASSLVATSAIVASALTGAGGSGALAALLGHALAADRAPAMTAPSAASPAPSAEPGGDGASAPATGASAPATPASPQGASGPVQPKAPAAPSKPDMPSEPTPEGGPIGHVFVVSLASPGYEASFGATSQMPYLSGELRPRGELLSGYALISDAGLANSIAAISGQPPNPATEASCPTYAECLLPVETLTLPDQLGSARLRWGAYVEGMVDENGQPHSCVHPEPGASDQPTPGAYATRQNPFAYFHSLLDLGECASNDVPLTQLTKDLHSAKSTPNFTYVAPSLCNAGASDACPEGSPTGAAAADAFLARVAPEILASPAYEQDGLLIVNFDETAPGEGAPATPNATTGALLVSPFATPGATDGAPYTPYSLLRSVEDLFGLPHLAKAGNSRVKSFASGLVSRSGGD